MSYRKNGLKVLGLCLMAALGLMAFAAASAQAETGGLWLYLLTVGGVSHDIPVGTPINVALETDATLHSTVGGSSILILCKTLTLTDGLVLAEGKGLGTLAFTNCETLVNGLVNANCKPAEPISVTVRTLPILHNNTTYIVFEKDPQGATEAERLTEEAEEKFVTISLGASCVVGNKFVIKGLIPFKECGVNSLETHLVEHLIEAAQSLFAGQTEGGKTLPSYQLKFGVNSMSLLGSVKLGLGDPLKNLEWGLKV